MLLSNGSIVNTKAESDVRPEFTALQVSPPFVLRKTPKSVPAYNVMLLLAHFHIGDKIRHFTAYFVLAFIPALHEKRATVLVASVGAVVLGVLLEFGQIYSVGRQIPTFW